MASPETVGTCACENCGSLAYVKKNRGGFPYYRCGKCDKESREHSQNGARLFMQKVSLFETEAPAAVPEKSSEKPAATPPAKTKAPSSMVAAILGL